MSPVFIAPSAAARIIPSLLLRTASLRAPSIYSVRPTRAIRPMSSAAAPTTPYVTALTTAPDQAVATKIADALVERRLAACVTTVPQVSSTYWWEGAVERQSELLLLIKTRAVLVEQVTATVKELHPFEVPELIVHRIVAGSADYLDWIGASTMEVGG